MVRLVATLSGKSVCFDIAWFQQVIFDWGDPRMLCEPFLLDIERRKCL